MAKWSFKFFVPGNCGKCSLNSYSLQSLASNLRLFERELFADAIWNFYFFFIASKKQFVNQSTSINQKNKCVLILSTVKLDYNELGYNDYSVITITNIH